METENHLPSWQLTWRLRFPENEPGITTNSFPENEGFPVFLRGPYTK